MLTIEQQVLTARARIRALLGHKQWHGCSANEQRRLIARYAAAVAVNFTDWMGKTLPWARHELACFALTSNLRCETTEDHVGMLLNFASDAGAVLDVGAYEASSIEVARIRDLFRDPNTAGLAGIAIMAALESTSIEFIQVLEAVAENLGVTNLEYTRVHGEADIEHSDMFVQALKLELASGYPDPERTLNNAFLAVHGLLERIFG
jgi:hypothetical protein